MNDAVKALFEKATDHRNPLLSQVELDGLWEMANHAMHAGRYQEAFMATEALLCQADRGAVVKDELPNPRRTKCCAGLSGEMSQGFVDRVEAVNRYV